MMRPAPGRAVLFVIGAAGLAAAARPAPQMVDGTRHAAQSQDDHPRAMRAAASLLLVLAFAILLPVSASAQTIFLQGAFGGDVRRFSGEDADRVFDAATRDLSIAAAGFITEHVTAGLELDFGGTSREATSVSLPIAGRPETVTTDYSLQRRTVSAVAGIHSSHERRVQAGFYAGISFTSARREIASDAPPVVLSEPPEPVAFTDRTADPMIGADVAVQVARAVAVVGGVRAHGLALSGDLRGFTVRPRVGIRVVF